MNINYRLASVSWPQKVWRSNKGLTVLIIFAAFTLLFSILALIIDPRSTAILNTPTWIKTFKFCISFLLYAAGLLWILERTKNRVAKIAGSLIGWILSFELVLILIQGARAVPMHYNQSTPFDTLLYGLMSIGIQIMFVVFLVLLVQVWRTVKLDTVLSWSVRLGLIITLFGLLQGFTMPQPTSAQLEAEKAGQTLALIGAHTVGSTSITPDNGAGLPLLGWSTQHGDLRIGHFIGIHALQLLPLFGLWLSRRRELWLGKQHRLSLVWIAGLAYLGVMLLMTWQALRGQPLLSPDSQTLLAWAVLTGVTGFSSWLVIWKARHSQV